MQKHSRPSNRILADRIRYTHAHCPVCIRPWRGSASYVLSQHPEIEIQLILAGTGTYLVNGKRYAVAKDVLLVIPPRQTHCFMAETGVLLSRITLIFRPAWLSMSAREHKRLAAGPTLYKLKPNESSSIENVMRRLHGEIDNTDTPDLTMIRLLMREFLVLLNRVSTRIGMVQQEMPHPAVQMMMRMIGEQALLPDNIAAIIMQTGYSVRHARRLFKKHVGIGLKQFILACRISAARDMLVTRPQYKLEAVARDVGFSGPLPFAHAFKKETGMTPGRFRAWNTEPERHHPRCAAQRVWPGGNTKGHRL